MWVGVGTLIALSWLVFFFLARPLASTLERGEVMVLKPLSITYVLLAIALAVSSAWVLVALSVLACLLNGAMGASLHKSRTFTELAEGTIHHMQKGPRVALSRTDSHLLASVTLRAAMILSTVMVALLIHNGLRWYVAVPAAFIASWVFMAGSTIAVAYQRKA